MMYCYYVRLSLLLVFSSITSVFSQNFTPTIFSDSSKLCRIDHNILILEDPTSSLEFEEALSSKEFKKSTFEVPNLGVSTSTFWIKFSIQNKTSNENLLLQLSYPIMDVADLYHSADGVNYKLSQAGDLLKYSNRKYNNPNFIYEIKIKKNESRIFFLKIRAKEQIIVPLLISTIAPLLENNSTTDIFVGIYVGIILVMFLYNGFIFITTKDSNYLYYIIYILFIGITQVSLLGYSSKLLWTDNLWLSEHGLFISASIGSSAIAIFMLHFLHMKEFTPKLVYGVYIIVAIYTIALIATLLDKFNLAYKLIDINGILITAFSLFVASKIALKGYKPARYFLIGWTVFFIGVLVFVLRSFGVLPFNMVTNYTMPTGSAIEVILLSLALADRINILKKEKELSQAEALKISKENERLVTNQKSILEQEVAERTADLENAYRNLQETQSQLVNSEKMASLGQLTAGVAHEINNPINFVVSNINPLRRDINDIKELLSKYNALKNDDTYDVRLNEIENFKKEIDYNYVQEEIEILLKGISEGATRTSEIVKSLKNFSRLDEHDLKKTNINEGIASSIVLLSQQIDGIKVIQNLGQIPEIECFPGKINQAFMNILTNAIEAIHSHRKEGGILEITTYQQDEYVFATIKDNGTGMPEEVKSKIFEPFYTTKDVGKGTGLGLSITHGIIEKHQGTIAIQSEIGIGTTFEIKLPIQASTIK